MSRPRRDQSAAATERLSIRVTNAERARYEALARRTGETAADLVRRLVEREYQATDYVDQRSATKPAGYFHATNYPRHVFTLHVVPGRAEPICVRRPVHECTCTAAFEVARGRVETVFVDDLFEQGWAVTSGHSSCIDTGDGEWRELDLGARVVAFMNVPTPTQRREWLDRHVREQALLRRALRDSRLDLWSVTVGAVLGAPASKGARCQAHRPCAQDDYIELRGDLRIGTRNGSDDKRPMVNLFALAGDHYAWERTSFYGPDGEVAYCVDEPSPETLAAIGASKHAASVYWARVNRRTDEEAARKAKAGGQRERVVDFFFVDSMKAVHEACGVLGLSWPCSLADVERARRTGAKTHHPDRGGDELAMRRTNQAADVVRKHLEQPPTAAAR